MERCVTFVHVAEYYFKYIKVCYIGLCCGISLSLCKDVLLLFMLHLFNYEKMCCRFALPA